MFVEDVGISLKGVNRQQGGNINGRTIGPLRLYASWSSNTLFNAIALKFKQIIISAVLLLHANTLVFHAPWLLFAIV